MAAHCRLSRHSDIKEAPAIPVPYFHTFTQFQSWLEGKGLFHMELGLERMRKALAGLRLPPLPLVQVLGTNGKGSTSVFLAALARAHGLDCGLFLSPHFLSPRERVTINGLLVPCKEWLAAINDMAKKICLEDLTYFEVLTLLALRVFSARKVRLAVFEAGLGGKNDATSALAALAHCFTPVAMDHAAIIGPAIRQIAADKAAAIQPGRRVFAAPQIPAVREILERRCQELKAPLTFAAPLTGMERQGCALRGESQSVNAGLALAAFNWLAQKLGIALSNTRQQRALQRAFLPGRQQTARLPGWSAPIILDGAHNPHAIQTLARARMPTPRSIIYAALADKDWPACAGILRRAFPGAVFLLPGLDNPRAQAPEAIEALLAAQGAQAMALKGQDGMAQALKRLEGPALVCGSLYLLAEFYKLRPEWLGNFNPFRQQPSRSGSYTPEQPGKPQ